MKRVCCICGELKSAQIGGKDYCNKHWQRVYHYGSPELRGRKRTNTYEIDGDTLYIKTKNGQTITADASDFETLSKHSWCISKTGYAVANINHKTVKLHRLLLGLENPRTLADHINHNRLDNRRSNLRICTPQENARNKGGKVIRGIRKTPNGKYSARIVFERKEIYLGRFGTLDEAIQARHEAENKYHGEFAFHKSITV